MAISVLSCSYLGVETYIVEVEVDISNGLPVFNIVGMGDLAITESRERIRSCFKNIGLDFPVKRVLVNLSPANKEVILICRCFWEYWQISEK